MANRFLHTPDWSSPLEEAPRLLEAQFGDGYSQRTGDGINRVLSRFAVGFNNRAKSEVDAIAAFLRAHQGGESFEYVVPGEDWSVSFFPNYGIGVGDGSTKQFQLQLPKLASLYTDWQGAYEVYTTPRTNTVRKSGDIGDTGVWGRINAGTASVTPGVTSNYGVAPDGTVTATRVQFNKGTTNSTASYSQLYQAFAWGSFTTSCFSVWMRSLTGSTQRLSIACGSRTVGVVNVDVTTSWQRFSTTGAHGSSGTADQANIFLRGGTGNFLANTADVLVWGAQQEAFLSTPTKYIPNTSNLLAATAYPKWWPNTSEGFAPVGNFTTRPIVNVDGTAQTEGTHYTLSDSGLVTFVTAPTAGQVVSFNTAAGKTVKRVVCRSWRVSPEQFNNYSVSAEFIEVMA